MASPASELLVHQAAIHTNAAHFAALTGGRLLAVVKADAFGHGHAEAARAVLDAGAGWLGVASVEEALALRAAGIRAPVLSWLNPLDADLGAAIAAEVDLAVASPALLGAVSRAAILQRRRARVHLHLDLGMARDGCPRGGWSALCELAHELERQDAVRVVGIMGHLSCADVVGHPQTRLERQRFVNAVLAARRRRLRPAVVHLAATAATVTGEGAGFGLHRIGAGLFGIDPSGTSAALRPALSLTTRVAGARELEPGGGVGYGLEHRAERRTNLALLPLGYADGLPRSAAGRAEVLVRGRRCPLVGRFSMDMVVVDTGGEQVRPGEPVTVFGPGDDGEPTVADWAGWAGTIPHEIVTRIGSRVARVARTTGSTAAARAVGSTGAARAAGSTAVRTAGG
ncbi:alanine racemase [Agromyces mediolanus]|uniref:alanine racemase n=1 Tax=Agromyces mediolanus TaxID=41986 RepID=UPI003834741E